MGFRSMRVVAAFLSATTALVFLAPPGLAELPNRGLCGDWIGDTVGDRCVGVVSGDDCAAGVGTWHKSKDPETNETVTHVDCWVGVADAQVQ